MKQLLFSILLATTLAASASEKPAAKLNANMQALADGAKKNNVLESIANIPVSFRKNMGQWDEQIAYRGFSPGWNANIYFLKNGLSFGLSREIKNEKQAEKKFPLTPKDDVAKAKEFLVWNLYFKGMNPGATITSEGEQNSRVNYLIGSDPAKHHTNIPDYQMLHYNNVYDNIDARYYSTGQNIKYDFILNAGADISKIQMVYEGIKNVRVNEKKQLEITNAWGTLIEEMPESYQIINGVKKLVAVEYVALNNTTFGFKVKGDYDKTQTLIIDPVILAWSTYFGNVGTFEGYCHDVAVDPTGNVYLTGFYEDGFPVSPGAYGSSFSGQQDAFVIKLSADATTLIYATYLGGLGIDWGYGIAVNNVGEAFITGWTGGVWSGTSGFPVTAGAYQTTPSTSNFHTFVTRLNASGTAAIYSTYICGTNVSDQGYDIAINSANEAFVTGVTGVGFPTTAGCFQPSPVVGGWGGAFVTKLNANGTSLIYSSYLGGSSGNYGYGIAVDASGAAYVTGETGAWVNNPPNYTDFPITAGAYMTCFGQCGWKAFAAKVNPAGSALVYCTFIGGTGNCPQNGADVGEAIAVNSLGEAYVVGGTNSSNFHVTAGCQPYGGYGDAFLVRLNTTGTGVIYSTCLGGGYGDQMWGVAVNSANEAFVSGNTETDDGSFPVTSCAYQSVFGGQSTSSTGRGDIFVAKFNNAGVAVYTSFVGGNSDDYKYPRIVLHGPCEEEIIVNGTSHSSNFPTTAGVYMQQKGNGGDDQPVVFKMKPKINPLFKFDSPFCNLTVNFKDTTTGVCIWQAGPWSPSTWHWDFGDGTTSTQQNPTHTYATSGTYQVKLIVTCPKDSITLPVTVSTTGGSAAIASVPPICIGNSTVLTASGGSGYVWNTGATTTTITVTPTVTTTYSVLTTGTCPGTATTSVVVNPLPTIIIGSNSPVCIGQVLNLTANGGLTYSWSGPNSFSSTQQNPSITNATQAATGTYSVAVTNANGCVGTASTNVIVNPTYTVVYTADTACLGSNTTFTDLTVAVPAGSTYTWSFGDGTSSAQVGSATHIYSAAGVYTSTLAIGNVQTCVTSASLQVVVKALPIVNHVNPLAFCPLQITQAINFTSTPGGASSTFFWANTNTAIGLGAGGSNSLPSFTTANPGNGSITAIILVHASFNGCTGPDSAFTITVNPNPLADFSGQNKICLGTSMQLTDLSSGTIAQWNWDLNNDGNFTDANTQNPSYTFTTPGTHTVGLIVSVNAFCKDTVVKYVYVNPTPQPLFIGDHLKGCPVLNVNFTDQSVIAAPAHIVSWNWNFGNGTTFNNQFPQTVSYTNISHTQNATYTVSLTVVSDSGCSASITKANYITVYPRPTADFTYNTETDGLDPMVHFYDQSAGATSIHWYLGDIFLNPNALNYTNTQNPSHTYMHEEGFTYYITQWVSNSFGCTDSITKPIEVKPGFAFYIPNAFTPEGDGLNDGFKGTGVGIDNDHYRLLIFDRWGNQVFEGKNLETSWDGRIKSKGDVVQEDVYVWKVQLKDLNGMSHEYKGTVTLVK